MLEFGIIPKLYYEVKKIKTQVCILCCHVYKEKNEHTFVNLFIH